MAKTLPSHLATSPSQARRLAPHLEEPHLRSPLTPLVDEFMSDLEGRVRSPATISAYYSDLLGMVQSIGDRLSEFDLANVKTFLQSYALDHLPRSTARRVSCYRQFARFLCEKGYLTRNPLEFLRSGPWRRRLEASPSDTTGLDRKEVNQLLQECDRKTLIGRRDYAILMLMLGTGARVGDVINLNFDALELSPKRCRVTYRHRKGGRFSQYSLSGPYRQALEHYLADRTTPAAHRPVKARRAKPSSSAHHSLLTAHRSSEPVFLSRQVRRMTRQTVFARVKELVRKSRIPQERKARISPHSLRHTYVSRLWEQEKDIALVSQAAGHASPTVTLNVYTHIAREKTDAAIARMQELNP